MKLDDLELTVVYAALVHSLDVCNIYREQDEDLRVASERVLDRVTRLMYKRKLISEDKETKR